MNGVYIGAYLGKEKKCPICGKTFYTATEEWAYKRQWKKTGNYFYMCSWKCLRKWEASHQKKVGKPRNPHEKEIYEMLRAGEYPKYIAEKLGVSVSTVWYYKDRMTEEMSHG